MKIVAGIMPVIYKSLKIDKNLERAGHEVKIFFTEDFSLQCSYAAKKLDELGFHSARDRYNSSKFDELFQMLKDFNPEALIFFDLVYSMFTVEQIRDIGEFCRNNHCKFIAYFVDPLKKQPQVRKYLQYFDRVFSYDHADCRNFSMEYCPVGYSFEYENVNPQLEREIDLVFIGSPWKSRLTYFEPLAKYALKSGKRFEFYGPIAQSRYFWKRGIIAMKYPHVSKCIINRRVTPESAAEIYSRSKICLNLHIPNTVSPNPRTFEILATGSFELVDERENYAELLPGTDLATFNSPENLVEKVEYFLQHEDERMEIARNGHKKVVLEFRLANCLERILK